MNETNSIPKTLAPIGGAGLGVGLATSAQDDWIRIMGAVLTFLSIVVPIVQSMLAKRKQPPTSDQ